MPVSLLVILKLDRFYSYYVKGTAIKHIIQILEELVVEHRKLQMFEIRIP